MNGIPSGEASSRVPIKTVEASPGPAVSSDNSLLSLNEAAAAFNVPKRTLLRALTLGELHGVKVRGLRGWEWRVTSRELADAGLSARVSVAGTEAGTTCPDCRRLGEQLTAERARSAQLDSHLGYALLANGRLRAQLVQAGIEPDTGWCVGKTAALHDVQPHPDQR